MINVVGLWKFRGRQPHKRGAGATPWSRGGSLRALFPLMSAISQPRSSAAPKCNRQCFTETSEVAQGVFAAIRRVYNPGGLCLAAYHA